MRALIRILSASVAYVTSMLVLGVMITVVSRLPHESVGQLFWSLYYLAAVPLVASIVEPVIGWSIWIGFVLTYSASFWISLSRTTSRVSPSRMAISGFLSGLTTTGILTLCSLVITRRQPDLFEGAIVIIAAISGMVGWVLAAHLDNMSNNLASRLLSQRDKPDQASATS